MTGSFRVLRAELVRICASRAAWLGLALVALIPALGCGPRSSRSARRRSSA